MIARLNGVLSEKFANRVVLEVQGVGYEVFIPFSTYYDLGEVGSDVTLQIHTHVREDALQLFGFLSSSEKRLFTQLIQLSGIGPKLAITILSGLPVEEFAQAVSRNDLPRLNKIPGVGKKTAERILLELRDKIAELFPSLPEPTDQAASSALQQDVLSALINLGYARNVAEKAIKEAESARPAERFDDLLRLSLRKIQGHG